MTVIADVRSGRSAIRYRFTLTFYRFLLSGSKIELCRDLHDALLPGSVVFAKVGPKRFGRAGGTKVVGDAQRAEVRYVEHARTRGARGRCQVRAGIVAAELGVIQDIERF